MQAGLRHAGSHFTLEMPFGPPFGSVWVEDLTVKVTLCMPTASLCLYVSCFVLSHEGSCSSTRTIFLGVRVATWIWLASLVSEQNVNFKSKMVQGSFARGGIERNALYLYFQVDFAYILFAHR